MTTITINQVRDSVISALHQSFPAIPIYGEEIKQGFEEPCFFVKLFPASQDQILGRRHQRNHTFDIHYFPASETGANEEMHDMAEQLYETMEHIPVISSASGLRGTHLRHEITDEVLHFFVDYNFQVFKQADEDPLMQTMEQEGNIRGD